MHIGAEFRPSKRRTVSVHALGCKANLEEMECLLSQLADAGYEIVRFGEPADWTIVNTCTVTGAADSDSRQFLRRAAAHGGRVVATGCLAQRSPDTLRAIDGVAWVVGNQEKPDLAQWILDADASQAGSFRASGPSSTSAPSANSTAAPSANSTAAPSANSTSTSDANSTSAPSANSTSTSDANFTSLPRASSTSARGASSTSQPMVRVAADPTLTRFASYGSSTEGRRTRATLKIQDGCDEHCTFCVIPQVRGASRSRSLQSVRTEAERLAASGYREIALTAINTALWGRDLSPSQSLPELLRTVSSVSGIERVRLNSLEPQYLCEEWIEAIASDRRICRHLHLPLQSGDAAILKRMNRRYGPEHYASVVERAASRIPELAVGADVLVGFPGETELQFESTRRFLASLPLAYLHVFSYSERPDTPAPRLGEEVPVEERKRRSSLLRELGLELRARFLGQLEGTVQEVLPEGPSGPDHWQGLTDNYVRVRFPWTGDSPENRIYRVRLQDAGSPVSAILIEDRPTTETRSSTEAHSVSPIAEGGSNAWSGSRRANAPENVPT